MQVVVYTLVIMQLPTLLSLMIYTDDFSEKNFGNEKCEFVLLFSFLN